MLSFRLIGRIAVTLGLGAAFAVAALMHAAQPVAATPPCSDSWSNASGGSWETGANWSNATPPTATDDACLPSLGSSYTVTDAANHTVHSLSVGSASGMAVTLVVAGAGCTTDNSLTVTTDIAVLATGGISLSNVVGGCHQAQTATLNWSGTLTNTGSLSTVAGDSGGARNLRGNLTNSGTVNITVNTASDTVSATFTNNLSLMIGNGATLTMSNGTFTNVGSIATSGTGTFSLTQSTFNQGAGSAGSSAIMLAGTNLNLTGSGAGSFVFTSSANLSGNVAASQQLTVEGVGCNNDTVVNAAAGFTNAGTITVTNAPGACHQAQTASLSWIGTLTNSGTINSNAGDAGGGRNLRGDLHNTGNLNLNTSTAFDSLTKTLTNDGAMSIGSGALLTVSNSTLTNNSGFTTAGTGTVLVTSGTLNQGANPAGSNPVTLSSNSTLNLVGGGAGSFVFNSGGNLSGNISASQQVTIDSVGCSNDSAVTAAGDFTNAGVITLGNVPGGCHQAQNSFLTWPGTLTNTGTINAVFGDAGGTRFLRGNLTNSAGTLTAGANTTYDTAAANFANNGTVNVTGGTFTLNASTYNNNGTFSLADTTRLVILSGTFTNVSGISSAGSGSIAVSNSTFNQGANPAGSNPTMLSGSTLNLNGAGAGNFVFISNGTLTGNVAAAQLVTVEGTGCVNDTVVTAAGSFTSAGTILLTNAPGACHQAQTATLTWSGTLTITGSLSTVAGDSGGARNLRGNLVNSGNVTISTSTAYDTVSAVLTNNNNTSIGTGATLTMSNGTFTNNGTIATLGTGALVLSQSIFNQGANSAGSNPVTLQGSTLNLNGAGAGTWVFKSNGNLTGNVAASQQLQIDSVGCVNDTTVTATGPFSNAGSITLTNVVGGCTQAQTTTLTWTNLFTNNGTVTTDPGSAGGSRFLRGNLTSPGTLAFNNNTNFDLPSTTLLNQNKLNIANGVTLAVSNNTLTNSGTITTTGTGRITVSSGTFNQGTKSAGSNPVTMAGSSLNLTGGGPGSWVFVSSGNLTGNVAAGQALTVEGVGCSNDTTLSATGPFSNAGSITLTNVVGGCTQAQTATLTWSGTLTTSGSLSTITGSAGGGRFLRGNLTNNGTLSIGLTTNFDINGSALVNGGTVKLSAGQNLLLAASASYTQQAGGTFEPSIDAIAGQGQLLGAGSAALAGTLKVDTTGEPTTGHVYPLVSAASLTGTFATLNFQQEGYVVSYSSTQATILVDAEPSITSLSKKALVQGSTNTVITVTGANFSASITAGFSGTGITINNLTFVSSTKLTVTVTVSGNAPVGARIFTVVNPDQGAASTKFRVDPPPAPTSASPNALGQGATAQTVLVTGTGFVAGDKASFSSAGVTVNSTTVVSLTQLKLSVTVSPTATTGLSSIAISNPDGGAGTCTNCFTVNAGPTVTGASPSSVARGTTNQNVVITGTNFVNGATVSFSGSGITVNSATFNSATQITVNITVSATAATGARTITAVNPDHGQGSSSTVFTIT